MDQLGQVTLKTISFFGHQISFNPNTFIMTWLVMGLILLAAYVGAKNLRKKPGKLQSIFELIHEFLEEITIGTLGEKDGRKYLPFIITLFIFILLANWVGVLPNVFQFIGGLLLGFHKLFGGNIEIVGEGMTAAKLIVPETAWYRFLFNIPLIEEPTRSVNTDLALAIFVFVLCLAYGFKNKGLFGFFKSLVVEPFPMEGFMILLLPANIFLNLIGLVANVVSHSFRLFGNIFGGGMIIVIVSSLLKFFIVPVALFAFFGLFAGLVQAFVFTMLAVSYLQQNQ